MRSLRGVLGATVFLLALPLGLLYQLLFGHGLEIVIHLFFGVALLLIALSLFDFTIPRWIPWTGCVAVGALAAIFLLQGASDLIPDESLRHLAYDVLGQRFERGLGDLTILTFAAIVFFASQGRTRIFGFVALAIVVCLEAYAYLSAYLGTPAAQGLKLFYLLLFVWYLLESRKRGAAGTDRSSGYARRRPPQV